MDSETPACRSICRSSQTRNHHTFRDLSTVWTRLPLPCADWLYAPTLSLPLPQSLHLSFIPHPSLLIPWPVPLHVLFSFHFAYPLLANTPQKIVEQTGLQSSCCIRAQHYCSLCYLSPHAVAVLSIYIVSSSEKGLCATVLHNGASYKHD